MPEKSKNLNHLPRIVREASVAALRLAASADGAPKRCRRRACRTGGRCHMAATKDGSISCAASLGREVFCRAALMMAFLAELGQGR